MRLAEVKEQQRAGRRDSGAVGRQPTDSPRCADFSNLNNAETRTLRVTLVK